MTMEFEVVSLAPWAVFALIAVLLLTNVWLGSRHKPGQSPKRLPTLKKAGERSDA